MVIAASAVAAVASELVNKALVTDRPAYQAAAERVRRKEAEIEAAKAVAAREVGKKARQAGERATELEAEAKEYNTVLAGLSMRTMLITTFANLALFWILSSIYDGVAMLRLPFEPIGFLTGITHRHVPGDDMRDAGVVAVLVFTSMALRPLVPKLLGIEAPKTADPFTAALASAMSSTAKSA